METKLLYGLDKSGKYKVWSIQSRTYVDPVTDQPQSVIEIFHGQEGGKIQKKVEFVNEGKNISRANETTPAQQAELEAESRYKKQLDKGYRPTKEELVELPLLPMLAADYLKQGHRIKYPCYVSAKLDGVRCLAIRHEDRVELKSRGGKEYSVAHVQAELMQVMKVGDILDGELYIHGKFLEEIVSAVKKPNENTKDLHYIIFDLVSDDQYHSRRTDLLSVRIPPNGSLEILDHTTVFSEEEMKATHKRFVSCGYEGIILRNSSGLYESSKRSADLQKYKEFFDEEFQIVAVGEDKNNNAILCVFDPVAGETFTVCYGDFEQRKHQLENWKDYIGKWLTVKYQTRYKDSKLPQFPTGVMIRETDNQGNPLE